MRVFVWGLILGAAAVCAGVYAYFAYGYAPVATSAQAIPFEKMLTRKSLQRADGEGNAEIRSLVMGRSKLNGWRPNLRSTMRRVSWRTRTESDRDSRGHVSDT